MSSMLGIYILEGLVAAILMALIAGVIARKLLKLSMIWAIIVGAVVFTGLLFVPIKTHVVTLEMPRHSN
ncbi:MAG: hypothetical protein WCA81_03860 [Rhizomicrobium sp.]